MGIAHVMFGTMARSSQIVISQHMCYVQVHGDVIVLQGF